MSFIITFCHVILDIMDKRAIVLILRTCCGQVWLQPALRLTWNSLQQEVKLVQNSSHPCQFSWPSSRTACWLAVPEHRLPQYLSSYLSGLHVIWPSPAQAHWHLSLPSTGNTSQVSPILTWDMSISPNVSLLTHHFSHEGNLDSKILHIDLLLFFFLRKRINIPIPS